MRFFCPGCGTRYHREDDDIPPEGLSIPCEKCGFMIAVRSRTPTGVPAKPAGKAQVPAKAESYKGGPVGDELDDDDEKTVRADTLSDQPLASPPVAKTIQQKAASEEKVKTKTRSKTGSSITNPASVSQESSKPPKPVAGTNGVNKEAPPADIKGDSSEEMPPKPAEPPKQQKPRASIFLGLVTRILGRIGTGRSGEIFRFRDLFFAVAASFDPRKLLVAGTGIFIGSLIFAGVTYLGALPKNGVAFTIGLILGSLGFSVCALLGLGVTTTVTDREMRSGKHVPIKEGLDFVKTHLWLVLGTPMQFVLVTVLLLVCVTVLSLIGRIPVAGPIVYGLTFSGSFLAAFAAVITVLLLGVTSFSYLPLASSADQATRVGAKNVLGLVVKSPGRYLLHFLIGTAGMVILLFIINALVFWAFRVILGVATDVTIQDISSILIRVPLGLFGLLILVLPEGLVGMFRPALGEGWEFDIAGWLVGLAALVVFSLVLGFCLVYFFGAGVVNYHLLSQDQSGRKSAEGKTEKID